MTYSLTAPTVTLPDGVDDFLDHVRAVIDPNEWFEAPLSKTGKKLKGDTAAGQAVEAKLKIAVNNSDGPDIPRGRIEVKAGRAASVCPTTLCTKAPCFPKGANRSLITTYGYPCEEQALGCEDVPMDIHRLMVSWSAAQTTTVRNGNVFDLNVESDRFNIVANGVVAAGYMKDSLTARAERKLGGVLAHFEADSRVNDNGDEEFRVASLNLYWDYDEDAFWNALSDGTITVEPRLKLINGKKVRDRGTAFRTTNPSVLYRRAVKVI